MPRCAWPLAQPLAENATQLADAQNALDDLNRTLLWADEQSDLEIGAVLDEVWNSLGRPARSADFATIAGSGVGAWTKGPAVRQSCAVSRGAIPCPGVFEQRVTQVESAAPAQAVLEPQSMPFHQGSWALWSRKTMMPIMM